MPISITARSYGGRYSGLTVNSQFTVPVSSTEVVNTYEVVQYPSHRTALGVSGPIGLTLSDGLLTQTFESRWHQPWSEPVRFRVPKRLVIAEIVSGLFAPVLNPNTQITQFFESRWHYAWSEPVRFKVPKRLVIAEIVSGLFAPVLNPETQIIQNFESRWHQPWSEPIRISFKQGIQAQFIPYITYPTRFLPPVDVTIVMLADDPLVTDKVEMDVFVGSTEPLVDRTGVDVSINEVSAQSGGNLSITESE